LSIRVFYEVEGFRLKGWRKVVEVIRSIIEEGDRIPGDISFIITGDTEIRSINCEFLSHDFNTDVITFNYNKGDIVSGEIYISGDTVKVNAADFNVSFQMELIRVIIHGVLHLMGMDDSDEEQRNAMHIAEDKWLLRLNF
jgi:probable rRNA maturation factor